MTVGDCLDAALALLNLPSNRERLDDYRVCRRRLDFLSVALADDTELVSLFNDLRLLLRLREQTIIESIRSPHRAGEVRGAAISQDAKRLADRIRRAHQTAISAGHPLSHRQLSERFSTSTKTVQRVLKQMR